ncbi:Thiol:disulfide interchange protein DsbC [hydrothermal vent metagenome]|uniref:Thiol:disulfide interchange protein DsbC n=1 Tax=hydrothermal vent metagenome TaxID=652676 RepID=A0A3B0W2L3_9ZZZZ
MKKNILAVSVITFTAINGGAYANNDTSKYQQAIQKLSNQTVVVDSVNDTPVKGIKEIVVAGGTTKQVIYLSDDGEYLFDGNLLSIKNKTNLTESTQNSLRNELMREFRKTQKGIDFFPEQMTDQVTVFTDIDCGVCRKFHQDISSFNDAGIGISYLFFPRAGIGSPSHQKAVNVWCADNQQNAINQANNGVELEPLMCPNPIEAQFNLGLSAGVKGTPYMVLDDGTLIPGYMTPDQLTQRLKKNKAKN